ncbi:MAG: porin family protein [Cytophagaceae bacterium]|jgi:opacity protein-like surface antigen|nr:porin family protein [Cytophagaceae bacterium]
MKHIKNHIICLLMVTFVAIGVKTHSQTLLEGGPFVGVSWYNGDLNPQRLFYNVHSAFGAMLRYLPNDRLAFRGTFLVGGISGSYPQDGVLLHHVTDVEATNVIYEFKRNVTDVSATFEFNLFSFDHPYKKGTDFTPYISLGLGTTVYTKYATDGDGNNSELPHFAFSFPFGAGVKWKIKSKLRLGLEWTVRKTFADDLDVVGYGNIVNPSDPHQFSQWTALHNNDWVSFVGVYISFPLFNRRSRCEGGF